MFGVRAELYEQHGFGVPKHAAWCSSDWLNFELWNGVINYIQSMLVLGESDLLEESLQLVLNFLGLVEEIVLLLILLRQKLIENALELFWASIEGNLWSANGLIITINKIDPYGLWDWLLLCLLRLR